MVQSDPEKVTPESAQSPVEGGTESSGTEPVTGLGPALDIFSKWLHSPAPTMSSV